jgi:hypothetical protein
MNTELIQELIEVLKMIEYRLDGIVIVLVLFLFFKDMGSKK